MNVPARTISEASAEVSVDSSSEYLAEEIARLLRAVPRALRTRYAREVGSRALGDVNHYLPLLHQVAERPGVTVNELARLTGTPKSRVSVLVARLVELGIVVREADQHDTRLVRLRLTPRAAAWRAASGQALLRSLQPLSHQQLSRIVEGLALLLRALEQEEPVEGPGAC